MLALVSIGQMSQKGALDRKSLGKMSRYGGAIGQVQAVRFARSSDGTALAWTRSGQGLPLVKAANWLTHLEYDRASPVWSHWTAFLENKFDYLRYDERGCGLSDRNLGDLNFECWVDDLSAVIEAADLPKPFVLLGVSQGAATAIKYACAHSEKVSHLVLYGGYARGPNHRGDKEKYRAVIDIFRHGWGENNPAFQEVFTSRFIPDGGAKQRQWYNELCQKTLSPATGAELLAARADVNIADLLGQVRVPTLIIHARGDAVVPLSEGEFLAREISGAELVVLEGRNHILQADEDGWPVFCRLVEDFTGQSSPGELEQLTAREMEILRLICMAKSNKQIARDLDLSEKTIRNHASNLFLKVGLHSRQEIMLRFSRYFPNLES